MRNIFKSLLVLMLLALPSTFANAQSEDIAAAIKKNPGRSPEWLAEATGASEEDVIKELVAKYRIPISGDKFDEVWETLTTWENPHFITFAAGSVIEVNSRIPPGSYDQGFFNLDDMEGYGLSGHFRPENIHIIYMIEAPSREGGVSRQVAFYDEDGVRAFGIFVNRLESGGAHHEGTLAQFKEMQEFYRQRVLGEN